MILELKVPHSDTFNALTSLRPIFLSYALSFISYYILQYSVIKHHNILHVLSSELKGKKSLIFYTTVIIVALFYNSMIAFFIFIGVLFIWFIHDSRIEVLANQNDV